MVPREQYREGRDNIARLSQSHNYQPASSLTTTGNMTLTVRFLICSPLDY